MTYKTAWVEVKTDAPEPTETPTRGATWLMWAFPCAAALLAVAALLAWWSDTPVGDFAFGLFAGVTLSAMTVSIVRMVTP